MTVAVKRISTHLLCADARGPAIRRVHDGIRGLTGQEYDEDHMLLDPGITIGVQEVEVNAPVFDGRIQLDLSIVRRGTFGRLPWRIPVELLDTLFGAHT